MKAHMSYHAKQQLQVRPACSEQEILDAVNSAYGRIAAMPYDADVLVIVKCLGRHIFYPDGSNGDVVLAAVDPRNMRVKTVMLQRSSQVRRKMQTSQSMYL